MKPMHRRRFLQCALGAGAALAVSGTMQLPGATAAKGGALTKYLEPVPLPGAGIVVATPTGPDHFSRTRGSAASVALMFE